MRNKKGQFEKGYGFWTGKKHPKEAHTLIGITCAFCHNLFIDFFSNHRKYCSKSCGSKSRIAEKNPAYKGGKPKCSGCNKMLGSYSAKLCVQCLGKSRMGIKRPEISGDKNVAYKGGKYNTLILNRNRRYRKRGAEGNHTLAQWEELKMQCGYMCLCCKKQEPEIKLTEDHIIPISKGGSNNIENIQPLCGPCNSRKHIQIINYMSLLETTY